MRNYIILLWGCFFLDRNNVFKNTLLLTLSGIIAKTLDFFFRAFYSRHLGSEGCGLLSLVFSVHSIMLTFATAGISVATAKLVSRSVAERNPSMTKSIMKTALAFTFLTSAAVIFFGIIFSKNIAENILRDIRTQKPLLCLLPSVLFMSVSYCLKGYFYSVRKILIPASSEFLEQFVKITSISLLLKKMLPYGTEFGCMGVFAGLSAGEFSSCAYLSLFLLRERKLYKKSKCSKGALAPVLKTAFPAMISSLSGSYLHMQEELLTVAGLKKHGFGQRDALSLYGTVSGMVIPLTMFPLTLLSSFLTLLVPEISRAAARNSKERLADLTQKVYKFASVVSFMLFAVYFSFSDSLGAAVYGNPGIGGYIAAFSVLLPVIMTDSVSCGILNGLGKQTTLLVLTLSEAALRIWLCLALVPVCGARGIIIFTFAGCIFSFGIRLFIVISKTSAAANIKTNFIFPAAAAFAAASAAKLSELELISPQLGILLCISVYLTVSAFFKTLTKKDIIWIFKRLRGV